MAQTDTVRFDVPLPRSRKAELDSLAEETGVGPRDLARLAIIRFLADPRGLIPEKQTAHAA